MVQQFIINLNRGVSARILIRTFSVPVRLTCVKTLLSLTPKVVNGTLCTKNKIHLLIPIGFCTFAVMKHGLFALLVITLMSQKCWAQTDWRTYPKGTTSGSGSGLMIYQSPEITALSQRFKQEHQGRNNLKGFRVQVFVGERNRATDIKGQAEILFPGVPVEINYLAPNFRVRLGNFRTYLEADAFLQQVKSSFNNAYVVPDEIGLPPL